MTRSFPAAPHLSAHALTREVAFMNRTIIRYCGSATLPCAANPIRGDGQTRNEDERYLQIHVTREFSIGGQHPLLGGGNFFQGFDNRGRTQWKPSAQQPFSPNHLSPLNLKS